MGIILVYDCTEEQTFNNIQNWLKQIDQHASSNVAKILVANKCDRPDKVIESERGKALADQHGLMFFETSAKTGLNISDVFSHIAKVIIREKIPAGGSTTSGLNGAGSGFNQNGGKSGPNSAKSTIKVGSAKDEKGAKDNNGGCCN